MRASKSSFKPPWADKLPQGKSGLCLSCFISNLGLIILYYLVRFLVPFKIYLYLSNIFECFHWKGWSRQPRAHDSPIYFSHSHQNALLKINIWQCPRPLYLKPFQNPEFSRWHPGHSSWFPWSSDLASATFSFSRFLLLSYWDSFSSSNNMSLMWGICTHCSLCQESFSSISSIPFTSYLLLTFKLSINFPKGTSQGEHFQLHQMSFLYVFAFVALLILQLGFSRTLSAVSALLYP